MISIHIAIIMPVMKKKTPARRTRKRRGNKKRDLIIMISISGVLLAVGIALFIWFRLSNGVEIVDVTSSRFDPVYDSLGTTGEPVSGYGHENTIVVYLKHDMSALRPREKGNTVELTVNFDDYNLLLPDSQKIAPTGMQSPAEMIRRQPLVTVDPLGRPSAIRIYPFYLSIPAQLPLPGETVDSLPDKLYVAVFWKLKERPDRKTIEQTQFALRGYPPKSLARFAYRFETDREE